MPSNDERQTSSRAVHTFYHGTADEPGENEDGSYVLPAGTLMHPDEATAWNHAIRHWNDDEETAFPRVFSAILRSGEGHEPSGSGIRITQPAQARAEDYDYDRHPEIKIEDERGPILYHGTTHYHDGDDEDLNDHIAPEEITPSGGTPSFANQHDPNYAYATKSLSSAWSYAEDRQRNLGYGTPHVYRVTPKHPEDLEDDPHYAGTYSRGIRPGDMRSRSGFNVLDEVPPTRREHAAYVKDHRYEHDIDDPALHDLTDNELDAEIENPGFVQQVGEERTTAPDQDQEAAAQQERDGLERRRAGGVRLGLDEGAFDIREGLQRSQARRQQPEHHEREQHLHAQFPPSQQGRKPGLSR